MPIFRRILCVLLALTFSCSRRSGPDRAVAPPENADPASEEYHSQALPSGQVVLKDASGVEHAVEVEIAATADARTRGLMWRRHLPEGRGMLFIFSDAQVRAFWMKNTLIPLDMLFMDDNALVVGIVSNAVPLTQTPRGVPRPSRYVLEVPGGWATAMGIRIGSSARLELPAHLAVEP